MTSCLHSDCVCILAWSKSFSKSSVSGSLNFSLRLLLEAASTSHTDSLAGKGLKGEFFFSGCHCTELCSGSTVVTYIFIYMSSGPVHHLVGLCIVQCS